MEQVVVDPAPMPLEMPAEQENHDRAQESPEAKPRMSLPKHHHERPTLSTCVVPISFDQLDQKNSPTNPKLSSEPESPVAPTPSDFDVDLRIKLHHTPVKSQVIARGRAKDFNDIKARHKQRLGKVTRHDRQAKLHDLLMVHQQQVGEQRLEVDGNPGPPFNNQGKSQDDTCLQNEDAKPTSALSRSSSATTVLVRPQRPKFVHSKRMLRCPPEPAPLTPLPAHQLTPDKATSNQREGDHQQVAKRANDTADKQDQGENEEEEEQNMRFLVCDAPAVDSTSKTALPSALLRENDQVVGEAKPLPPSHFLPTSVPCTRVGAAQKSSAEISCELDVMKTIMVREQLLSRLNLLAQDVDGDGKEYYGMSEARNALALIIMQKERRSFAQPLAPSSPAPGVNSGVNGPVVNIPVPRTAALKEMMREQTQLEARQVNLVKLMGFHWTELAQCITNYQLATLDVVENLLKWRKTVTSKQRRSNFQTLHRFAYGDSLNYLLDMEVRVRPLFGYQAIKAYCLQSHRTRRDANEEWVNALLLPDKLLAMLGLEHTTEFRTFLTDRRDLASLSSNAPLLQAKKEVEEVSLGGGGGEASNLVVDTSSSSRVATPHRRMAAIDESQVLVLQREDTMNRRQSSQDDPLSIINLASSSAIASMDDTTLYNTIVQLLLPEDASNRAPDTSHLDLERCRICLEAIWKESLLEQQDRAKQQDVQASQGQGSNPFASIKDYGGVERAFSTLLENRAPQAEQLAQQLQKRQQDASRTQKVVRHSGQPPKDAAGPSSAHHEALVMRSQQLRQFFEKKKQLQQESAAAQGLNFEIVARQGSSEGQDSVNRLQGQVLRRRVATFQVENHSAWRIQQQYRAFRFRACVLLCLAKFSHDVHLSATTIQRIYRGHCAKRVALREREAVHHFQMKLNAACLIQRMFKRIQRRKRHRCSMTVESIIEKELLQIREQELSQKYRKIGEARRIQRALLMQQKREEQEALLHHQSLSVVVIQSHFRAYLARMEVLRRKQDQREHVKAVSAITIQSAMRRYLTFQREKHHKFLQDLDRVNKSAVRIQSTFRGYNSRLSFRSMVSAARTDQKRKETLQMTTASMTHLPSLRLAKGGGASATNEQQEGVHLMMNLLDRKHDAAPGSVKLQPSSVRKNLITPPSSVLPPIKSRYKEKPSAPRGSLTSSSTTWVELKLKEPTIGEDL